jgi:molybdenum cofactor cytidylyltransferase
VFPELLKLSGDVGAKNILQQRGTEVAKLHFEEGLVDIDTPEDYQQLLASKP